MPTPKWKYAKEPKKKDSSVYIRLEDNTPTKMLISDWTFEKNPYTDALFSCTVKELDGEEADRIWTVWDFDLKEELKKRLKGKSANKDTEEITVTKREKDMEEYFELKKKK